MKTQCQRCKIGIEYTPITCFWIKMRMAPTHCDACSAVLDAEHRTDQQDERQQRFLAAWADICPPLYRDTDPARLPKKQLAKVMSWTYGPRGLLLHGSTGKGKTRCAYQLLHRLHFEEHRRIIAMTATSFSHYCGARFGNQTGEKWIRELSQAEVFFLDDLGKGRLTERAEAELFGLIEARIADCLPLILTTNATGASLVEQLSPDRGEPLVRRLREFCESVTF